MKQKRILFAVFGAIALIVSGCGKRQNADGEGKSTSAIIGISIPAADHGWTGGVVYWAEQAKKDLEKAHPGLKVIVAASATSDEQVNKIENMMVQGISALVVLPNEPAPLTQVCTRAAKKGIKLVVVDRGLTKDVHDLYVAGDNAGFGRLSAECMARELKGTGSLVVMEGASCQVNTDRVEAFREVMKKYPGIRILESQISDWKTERGLQLMENYLQKYPKIDAVWAGDDDVLLGALKAYQESGRNDVKLFVGGGGAKSVVKKIMDGDPLVRQTVTYPPKMIYVAAEEAWKLISGEASAEKKRIVPAEEINHSNAKDFYFPDSSY